MEAKKAGDAGRKLRKSAYAALQWQQKNVAVLLAAALERCLLRVQRGGR